MHLENLRFFYEVAQTKSISTVAKNSHISQSALSQQLSKLEDTFNAKLLIRSNKGVTLTKAGKIAYIHCEAILNTYSKLIEELESLNNNNSLVTVDGTEIITSIIFPMILDRITKFFPSYKIKIISSEYNCNSLINNNADIHISYSHHEESSEIISKELYSDKLIFIANSKFKKDLLTIDEFINCPLILINDKLNIKKILNSSLNLFNKDIYSLSVILNTNNVTSAVIALDNTKAITPIPQSVYNVYYRNLGYKQINIENLDMPLTMYISFTEQLYKREKLFLDKLTQILKGFLK